MKLIKSSIFIYLENYLFVILKIWIVIEAKTIYLLGNRTVGIIKNVIFKIVSLFVRFHLYNEILGIGTSLDSKYD